MSVPVQRASARFVTQRDGWTGSYCFSYDEFYDPANISFERMLACNEFVLEPGAGFGLHRHAGIDIATTVLEGVLTHVDPDGREERGPGSYVLRTGAGVEHDERNDGGVPVRFVQAWFAPAAVDPRPQRLDLSQPTTVVGPSFVLVVGEGAEADGTPLEVGDSLRVPAGSTLHLSRQVGGVLVWRC